ncbi:hypothetical protein [Cryobacterium tagatosivorans]|uniref:DUF8094 domain-containing protein n=1 Tax=Cryobacterium tagatosivorans TaxID=1259199 RepID=A0A4R8UBH9_9MICO|nr:hypothetical protein [Cryobacterium tagatosivorans]TFB46462.1 hypothetical protein E3O23_16860 [Cryobacterium tagatosivorans]
MRFVLAIVAFVLAAVMIMLGIAQRTVFLEPASTSLSVTVEGGDRYAVITSKALRANPGNQTITVSGPGTVFLAYGRSADVDAWLSEEAHAEIGFARTTGKLTSTSAGEADPAASPTATPTAVPTPSATAAPDAPAADAEPAVAGANPAGSDLWLEEFTADRDLKTRINVPAGISVIVASDGTQPAPTKITLDWPADNATPLAGPLIAGGAVLLLIGLILYLLALMHMRRSRGPRRNLPKGPRMPRLPRAPRPKSIKANEITGPRRSITRSFLAVVPVVLVSSLALSGCSADFWPSTSSKPSAAASPTAGASDAPKQAEDVPPPAVTVPQLERIVRKIAVLTRDADVALDAEALATRFTGPALEQRLANYTIRTKIKKFAALPALPASPLTLTLPQQSSAWPRVVMTVILDKDNPTVAPTAIVLRQENPRANYLVEYAVQLEAAAQVPGVAPAVIGAPLIAPDSKLLLMPPEQIAAAYADVLLKGEASEFFDLFEAKGDTFRTQVGLEKKTEKKAKLPKTASIAFGTAVGTGKTIALATNDSGSIVAVSIKETETVKPVDAGATVSPEGASKALSGVSATAKGIQSIYGDQLLFHVPAAGSTDKIVLLGFAQGLISSAELK